MRASVRSRTAGYAGHLHAEIVGHPCIDGRIPEFSIHLRRSAVETHRSDGGNFAGSGDVCGVDDSSVVRVRRKFPTGEVLAGSEQDDGDGGDSGGGAGAAHLP